MKEERVLELLQSVAIQERMTLFEWSITRGLTMHDEGPVQQNGVSPLAMLQHLHRLTAEALWSPACTEGRVDIPLDHRTILNEFARMGSFSAWRREDIDHSGP